MGSRDYDFVASARSRWRERYPYPAFILVQAPVTFELAAAGGREVDIREKGAAEAAALTPTRCGRRTKASSRRCNNTSVISSAPLEDPAVPGLVVRPKVAQARSIGKRRGKQLPILRGFVMVGGKISTLTVRAMLDTGAEGAQIEEGDYGVGVEAFGRESRITQRIKGFTLGFRGREEGSDRAQDFSAQMDILVAPRELGRSYDLLLGAPCLERSEASIKYGAEIDEEFDRRPTLPFYTSSQQRPRGPTVLVRDQGGQHADRATRARSRRSRSQERRTAPRLREAGPMEDDEEADVQPNRGRDRTRGSHRQTVDIDAQRGLTKPSTVQPFDVISPQRGAAAEGAIERADRQFQSWDRDGRRAPDVAAGDRVWLSTTSSRAGSSEMSTCSRAASTMDHGRRAGLTDMRAIAQIARDRSTDRTNGPRGFVDSSAPNRLVRGDVGSSTECSRHRCRNGSLRLRVDHQRTH